MHVACWCFDTSVGDVAQAVGPYHRPKGKTIEAGLPTRPVQPITATSPFVGVSGIHMTLDGAAFYFGGTNWYHAIQNDTWTYTDQVCACQ